MKRVHDDDDRSYGPQAHRKAHGYTDCPCRDCFDIAMDGDLCNLCEEAGCSADGDEECQRDDYGVEGETA